MNDRVRVGSVDDLQPGDREIVDVDGRSIGVFNVEGEYYAILNQCLHDCGPVATGRVKNQLVGTFTGPGERIKEEFSGPPSITCPWHGWEYRLATGEHVGVPDVRLPTYEVVVEDDVIYVEV